MTGLIAAIDDELARPTAARAALVRLASAGKNKPGPMPRKKRNLSPEGRKRIAEAVKRRWAKQKAEAKKAAK